LLSGGGAFVIEMLQRALSQDYQSMATLPGATPWPPIPLFGTSWSPMAATTWLTPIALFATGGVLARLAKRLLRALTQREEAAASHASFDKNTAEKTA